MVGLWTRRPPMLGDVRVFPVPELLPGRSWGGDKGQGCSHLLLRCGRFCPLDIRTEGGRTRPCFMCLFSQACCCCLPIALPVPWALVLVCVCVCVGGVGVSCVVLLQEPRTGWPAGASLQSSELPGMALSLALLSHAGVRAALNMLEAFRGPLLYYAECHGVIYVIDSTDEERLSESKQAFEKMVISEALDGVPILVLANKQDVEQGGARGH
ncbi:ADP-ribosylation factor-related protein 1 isoform X3 [Cervus elaphus]|uniref:ADP-ribosylation factor-related protein 1 isoform X3 n=1 Tax=Cervus canadensis TaxID=1574408 RepID=UPI001C9E51EC|nr:ADP-ribosylation factor-related protein 1 isoform X3 [Cervus canadensis]XP_043740433.1 ADP-ribosylation factor-related protein 1 isoform X3 [Cervus elaphus]